MLALFVYGTLRDPAVVCSVAGRVVVGRSPAWALGLRHRVEAAYPAVSFEAASGKRQVIPGELLWLDADGYEASMSRIDDYEGAPHLFRRVCILARRRPGIDVEAYA